MNKSRFITLSLLCSVIFVFVKIYQHNRMVQCGFEKQRLERSCEKLDKEKGNLLVELYTLKNLDRIKTAAQNTLKMKQLKLSQVVTVTEHRSVRPFDVASSRRQRLWRTRQGER